MVAGIGFTVSIFVTTLAFPTGDHAGHAEEAGAEVSEESEEELVQAAQDQSNSDEAKIGILVGSMIAASVGLATLAKASPRRGELLGEPPAGDETAAAGS